MIFSCSVKSGWTGGFWMRRCWRPPGPQEQHVRVPCRPPGRGFPDEEFADLFPSGRGRPSIPATVMAAVIALRTLHDYSDRETAGAVRFDARWKVACGLAVDDEGFDAPRWCTGGGGSPSQSARTGSTTRSGRSWRRPGSSRAGGGGRWTPRSWRTRPLSEVVCR